jgi:hypothetical protein
MIAEVAHQTVNKVTCKWLSCQWMTWCEMVNENLGPGCPPIAWCPYQISLKYFMYVHFCKEHNNYYHLGLEDLNPYTMGLLAGS